jgi:hypothetical protein
VTNFFGMAASIVAIGVVTSAVVHGQAPVTAKAGQPTVSVTCSIQGPTPALHVTLTNAADRDVSILLGYTPGAPQPQVVNAVAVQVIRPATGATEEYVYVHPKYAIYAGRMDPWIVSLKPGAKFDVDLPLKDFISSMNYNALEAPVASGGQLVVDAHPVARQPGLWTGKVEGAIDACR